MLIIHPKKNAPAIFFILPFKLRKHLNCLTLLILVMHLSISSAVDINLDASSHFAKGVDLYESEKYKEALPEFQLAVELDPSNSHYHHMLGKCHGRIAESGNWITALRNVGKTLSEFRKAVELDANNIQALIDLEEFYRRAPGFLGGSAKKAKEIRKRLESLENMGAPESTVNKH
ncbi:MAG: tetratricopeptide repeat protein [Gammaproteobacteria bacterium]|nr:tetratricopeptide repeat protein [Gammaproteobacteria bacterium]